MQITSTMLNVPPYISTTWEHIISLRTEHDVLYISLKSGESIAIPGLDKSTLETIFEAHARYLENANKEITFDIPYNSLKAGGLTTLAAMRHIPEESELPDLPVDLLEKIAMLTKSFGGEEAQMMTPSDSTCNCTFCQLARAITNLSDTNLEEEKIADEDLAFRDWQIEQIDAQLYRVTSPLDPNEQYKVFLGEPLGCNCGENHCEHIKAVLQS